MKYAFYILIFLFITSSISYAEENTETKELDTFEKQLSYVLGLDLGNYFKSLEMDFDLELIRRGTVDSYNGNKSIISTEEAAKIQQQFSAMQQKKRVEKTLEMTAVNRENAEKFLKENKEKEGVITTASGLQYKIITAGEGDSPALKDTVTVHYKGKLLNETEFDSSYKRNQPATFQLDQVIPGWGEALQLMKPGATYELFIKPDLAYGDRGVPPVIEPGSLLVFEVNLIKFEKAGSEDPKVDK